MIRRPPRLPRPAMPQRNFRTPPEPGADERERTLTPKRACRKAGLTRLDGRNSKITGAGSLALQPISPGDNLEFAADGFFDRYNGVHLKHERRKHRTEFVNGHQIVAFHQHVAPPLPHSNHEEVDLEISWRFPLRITKKSILKLAGAFH